MKPNSCETIALTQFSHGAGCGCKISPKLLDQMLVSNLAEVAVPNLLVGNDARDDAAVYDLGNGHSVISTTDFFMPIVDDPFTFGRIAATNALSDVYAMGGHPLMAIAIFGWPIDDLPPEAGQQVLEGGRRACQDAGIPLAGGHSIDTTEPIFGLAVTGQIENHYLKRNTDAEVGAQIFLTKPLGIGILTTAQKQNKLQPTHLQMAIESMTALNRVGEAFAKIDGVSSLTDVTGFGLLGHLLEICEGSDLAARLAYDQVPVLPHVNHYLSLDCVPGGTHRNYESYGHKVSDELTADQKHLLCDPQTSGGLLAIVRPDAVDAFQACAAQHGLELTPIGETLPYQPGSARIEVV
ncbi:selenide, water dikinase SelD [Thiomicrospira sp. WB1]|uniref:selenide, water dikinase SelD n=1 Tax=Thiomicrospira sp. WB1 TaxID=1685380 RepID=UPI000749F18F|nr:selenide, water dikinase SelD [Thiomicrospira sp. WB1]KUJ72018.1 selenide, water dikinase [Thiomicrospira sp. WB1]